MRHLNRPLYALVVLASFVILAGTAQAKTESLNVQAGEDRVRTLDFAAGDRVSLRFSAIGDAPSTLHFWIAFANGATRDYGEVSECEIFLVSEVSGPCNLHFDNSLSSSSRLVTLNYEVEHYYFGIPQVPFIIIAITVFLVGIVAGYMIMGKYS